MRFSDRIGATQLNQVLQVETVDKKLRNHLWNALDLCYWKQSTSRRMWPEDVFGAKSENKIAHIFEVIWNSYFNFRIDKLSNYVHENIKVVDEYFFSCNWYEVYNFIEFIVRHDVNTQRKGEFIKACNAILEQDFVGYRFVGNYITPITSEIEIKTLEDILRLSDRFFTVKKHIEQAQALLTQRPKADYRNSIKESISAIEAICCIVSGKENATLGDAVKQMQNKGFPLHQAFVDAVKKLYGYTSDAEGIRHALLEETRLASADARFMLVICTAFVNYIIEIESRD